MNITNRLTWLSYLTFILYGCAAISQGVLIICIAKTYQINIANVGYLFFIPAAIQAIVTYGNGFILDRINIKYEIIVSFAAMFLGFTFMITGLLPLFVIGLVPLGLGYGLLTSIPNYIILNLHPEKKFQKLNYLNFFFSLGGMLGPFILGQLVDLNCPWQIVLGMLLVFIFLLGLFAYKIPFSYLRDNDQEESDTSSTINATEAKSKWHYSIYLISLAMLSYVLSECIFSTWIVSYLKIHSKFNMAEASIGLTIYWLFITFGRFAADKIGNYMKVYQFILGSSIIALAGYILVFFSHSTIITYTMIAVMGVGYAALYASLLSYGMDQLSYNNPKLMSLFVLSGTIGTILALPLSSFFVRNFGFLTALLIGLIFLLVLIVSIFMTLKDKNNPAVDQTKQRHWGAITRRTKVFLFKNMWFSLSKKDLATINFTKKNKN